MKKKKHANHNSCGLRISCVFMESMCKLCAIKITTVNDSCNYLVSLAWVNPSVPEVAEGGFHKGASCSKRFESIILT
jgi:hypothetical protein